MRLGIYGGTFSPPHNGHIAAAQAFVDAVKPDKLLIIPTNIPPHKESLGTADAADRLNMCSIAFSGIKCAEISGAIYLLHFIHHLKLFAFSLLTSVCPCLA